MIIIIRIPYKYILINQVVNDFHAFQWAETPCSYYYYCFFFYYFDSFSYFLNDYYYYFYY